jgi:hypothetical protein
MAVVHAVKACHPPIRSMRVNLAAKPSCGMRLTRGVVFGKDLLGASGWADEGLKLRIADCGLRIERLDGCIWWE